MKRGDQIEEADKDAIRRKIEEKQVVVREQRKVKCAENDLICERSSRRKAS